MNEDLFNEFVKKDLDKFNEMVSKGYFETSIFEEQILTLSDTLAMLYQAIKGGKYGCEEIRQGSLQAS